MRYYFESRLAQGALDGSTQLTIHPLGIPNNRDSRILDVLVVCRYAEQQHDDVAAHRQRNLQFVRLQFASVGFADRSFSRICLSHFEIFSSNPRSSLLIVERFMAISQMLSQWKRREGDIENAKRFAREQLIGALQWNLIDEQSSFPGQYAKLS